MSDEGDIDNEETFQRLMMECVDAIQRGEWIDREQLRRSYPLNADSLCDFLDNDALLKNAVEVVNESTAGTLADSSFAPTLDSQAVPIANRVEFDIGYRLKYIGEYEVIDEIARGGMGIVFKVRQTALRRIVALNMILAGRVASTSEIDRFQREARAATALMHPNIVGVHEIGQHHGHHYFTIDFIDGQSLAVLLLAAPLTPQRTAKLIKTIALAIHYAHQQGVLHRDLKPANILIDHLDQPHITDFGLAKALLENESSSDLTFCGQILGTPSYMSPEQAAAKHLLVNVASDVYSLGAIMYACLTGRSP